jgi:serpin B
MTVSTAILAVLLSTACGGQPADVVVQHVSMKLTDSSAGFGVTLMDRLLADRDAGNVFISPLSATLALSMIASGAHGDTRAAMLSTLGLDPSADPGAEAKSTVDRLAQSDASSQLELANSFWARKGLVVNPPYGRGLRDNFRAQISNIDFLSPAAPNIVNAWVSAATHHQITYLVDGFDPATVFYVVNATYFHAEWPTEMTTLHEKRYFKNFSGASVSVPMMRSQGRMTFVYGPDYEAVLVPYKGGRYSMLIVLPRKQLSRQDFSRFLTPTLWTETWRLIHKALGPALGTHCESVSTGPNSGAACQVYLELPRFKIDYATNLTRQLAAMGMAPAMGPGADLSDICAGCFVSDVIQKTHLEVDEKGTTATAATGAGGAVSLPRTVVIDRPFGLALIDNATDAPLFLGVIGQL